MKTEKTYFPKNLVAKPKNTPTVTAVRITGRPAKKHSLICGQKVQTLFDRTLQQTVFSLLSKKKNGYSPEFLEKWHKYKQYKNSYDPAKEIRAPSGRN